jgi:hypothetical protein
VDDSSLAISRRAAQRHALVVATGPPRSQRWTAPAAGISALGAAVALPLFRPAAVVLAAVAVLLLAVHRQDRQEAWRYAPDAPAPARLLPPFPPPRSERAAEAPAEPVTPVADVVQVPAQAVAPPRVPQPADEGALAER